jgi:hypothetical protein
LKVFNAGSDLPPIIYYIGDDNNVFPKDFTQRYIGVSTYKNPHDMLGKIYRNNRLDFCPNAKDEKDFVRMGLKYLGDKTQLQKLTVEVRVEVESALLTRDLKINDYFQRLTNSLIKVDSIKEEESYYSGKIMTIVKGISKDNLMLFKLIYKNNKSKVDVYTYIKKGTRVSNTLKSAFKNRTKKMDFSELLQFLMANPNKDYQVKLKKKNYCFGRTMYAKYIETDSRRTHIFKKQANSTGGYRADSATSMLGTENKKEMEVLI